MWHIASPGGLPGGQILLGAAIGAKTDHASIENSRDRLFALLDGKPVDRIPLMPITMMFAADQIGAKYLQYVTDYRVLVEGQICTAERFGCDFVSCISDPAREGGDLGAAVRFFDDMPPAFIESEALLADKTVLARLAVPDPCSGRRMLDRIKAAALFKEKVGTDTVIEGWVEVHAPWPLTCAEPMP